MRTMTEILEQKLHADIQEQKLADARRKTQQDTINCTIDIVAMQTTMIVMACVCGGVK